MSLLENYHDQDIKGPTVIQVTTVIYDIQTQSILPFIADFCNHDITIRELKILGKLHIFFFLLKKMCLCHIGVLDREKLYLQPPPLSMVC